MASFSHHVMRYANVKITRRGDTTRYEFDASPSNRMVIEVQKGGLTIVDEQDTALARGYTTPAQPGQDRKD